MALGIIALVVLLAAGGCGKKASSASSPTPSASRSSAATRLAAITGYLSQVRPIATQVGATLGSLPQAVKGIHKNPDATWTAAATKLNAIAAKLGSDAANLKTLNPPASLQAVQEAGVKGIAEAQSTIKKMADRLNKRSANAGVTKASIQSQVAALQAKLTQWGQQLLSAVQGAIGSPGVTPAP